MSAITTKSHDIAETDGLPLALFFTPNAIREHFEGDDTDGVTVQAMSDETLAAVGGAALTDDRLYRAFHDVLWSALNKAATEVWNSFPTQG